MSNLETLKKLREATNLGMTECKNALDHSNNNFDLAIEYLQKQGYKHKENVVSGEGIIATSLGGNPFGKWASIIEMNCQTDFAANSDLMIETSRFHVGCDFDDPHFSTPWFDETLSRQLKEQVTLSRGLRVHAKDGQFCQTYEHHNRKIGVIVVMNGYDEVHTNYSIQTFAQDFLLDSIGKFSEELCLHIAGASPKYLSVNDIPAEILAKQKNIFETQVRNDPKLSKKPDITKIIDGKMNKWFGEVVLLKQESLVHPKKTIEQLLQELSKEVGFEVKVDKFVRWQVGEMC